MKAGMPTFLTQITAATFVSLAWIPILARFLRAWWQRGNPISLAICVLIGFAIYVPTYVALTLPPSWSAATVAAIDGITCATFYGAILSAARRFPDRRTSTRVPAAD